MIPEGCDTCAGGKVVDIDAHEDSQVVAENLALQAAHGIEEAAAAPITS